jgi:hypothetical protein
MDSLLIAIVDAIFLFIGKVTFKLLKTLRIPISEFSHGGYVVLGFFFTIFVFIVIFIVVGALNGW